MGRTLNCRSIFYFLFLCEEGNGWDARPKLGGAQLAVRVTRPRVAIQAFSPER